jgi:Holliday junction resolvase RusA-like endonuclease
MPDQKINVDININADNLNQIPQYKAAFDSLKNSIDNLNKEILKWINHTKMTPFGPLKKVPFAS